MAAVASSVSLTFGVISTTVAVHSAIKPAPRNVRVHVDVDGTVRRVRQQYVVDEVGVVDFTSLASAREVPQGLVLLSADDVETVTGDAQQYKKLLDVAAHPAPAVEVDTAPGEKAYHLVPAAGQVKNYLLLVDLVASHPEIAFVTRFTPRTKALLARVVVREGVLLLQERVGSYQIKDAPIIEPVDVPADLRAVAEQVLALPGVVTDFDLATYRDGGEDALAAIVATRAAVPDIGGRERAAAAPRGASVDALAALQAMVDAAATPPKARAKRASRAKVAA